MAPKTGEDLSAFDDLFYMPTAPSGNSSAGFWETNEKYNVAAAPHSPSQLQVKSFYNKNDIPPAVTMDSTFNDEDQEEEDSPQYSFMNSPSSSPHNSAIDYSYSSPEYYHQGQEENLPWGNIQQSYTAPDNYSPQEESSPWGDIQQSYTAPDTTFENPFDLFETSTTTALKPSSYQYDVVQTQSTVSADSAMYNNYSLNEQFSKSFIDDEQPSTTAETPEAIVPAASNHKSEIEQRTNAKENVVVTKVAEAKTMTKSSAPPLVATEVLHPWSSEEEKMSPKARRSVVVDDMDTYRQGLKGDHGGPIKASLASGYTNANLSTDDIPTKLPVCWHKDLDKMKQQAKIERKRQKLAQKKEKQKPTQKCKGMRAVFGNPKPLQKPETSSISSTDAVKKTKSKQVLMNPNTNTKSTAKDPLKILFSNPKPLQKRPTAASRTLFV